MLLIDPASLAAVSHAAGRAEEPGAASASQRSLQTLTRSYGESIVAAAPGGFSGKRTENLLPSCGKGDHQQKLGCHCLHAPVDKKSL